LRTLVVGDYPPAPGQSATETVQVVRELVEAGDDVQVLSPQRGAAHHTAPLRGALGVAPLALRSRGFDHLVIRLRPGLILRANTTRPQWLAETTLLTLALRRCRRVTLVIDDVRWFPIGGRASRQLWGAVDHFVVRSEGDAAKLQSEGGVPGDRITVRVRGGRRAASDGECGGWSRDSNEPMTYVEVMDEIRRRAATSRVLAEAAASTEETPREPSLAMVAAARQAVRKVLGRA